MRKIKIAGAIIFLAMSLSSCTAVALGAGAVAGGYTCAKTTLCDKIKMFWCAAGGCYDI